MTYVLMCAIILCVCVRERARVGIRARVCACMRLRTRECIVSVIACSPRLTNEILFLGVGLVVCILRETEGRVLVV